MNGTFTKREDRKIKRRGSKEKENENSEQKGARKTKKKTTPHLPLEPSPRLIVNWCLAVSESVESFERALTSFKRVLESFQLSKLTSFKRIFKGFQFSTRIKGFQFSTFSKVRKLSKAVTPQFFKNFKKVVLGSPQSVDVEI